VKTALVKWIDIKNPLVWYPGNIKELTVTKNGKGKSRSNEYKLASSKNPLHIRTVQ